MGNVDGDEVHAPYREHGPDDAVAMLILARVPAVLAISGSLINSYSNLYVEVPNSMPFS